LNRIVISAIVEWYPGFRGVTMPRTWSLFLLLFLIFPGLGLFSQEDTPPDQQQPGAPPIESGWDNYNTTMYTRGDKTFTITLGVILPTYFGGAVDNNDHGLSVGGTGTLAFNYFMNSNIFLGGELSGMFCGTRAKNMLYIIPFGFRIGYQFVFHSFEFPLSLMIGAAPQRYLEKSYFGLILKPGASVFWRFNTDWSFGLNGIWWFLPQWPKGGNDAYGNFMEITLSARYHF